MAGWTVNAARATPIFNSNSPTAWTDLDLSSVVGSATMLVQLRVVRATAGYVGFRQNGETIDTYQAAAGAHGDAMSYPRSTDDIMVLVPTDAAGIAEWKAQAAAATQVYVEAYAPLVASGANVYMATAPTSWGGADGTIDLTAIMATGGLAVFRIERTGGTAGWTTIRPSGEVTDVLDTSGRIGPSVFRITAANGGCYVTMATGSARICQIASAAGASAAFSIVLVGYTNDSVDSGATLAAGAAITVSYGDISCGAAVASSLALIRFDSDSTRYFVCREKGTAYNIVPSSYTYPDGVAIGGVAAGKSRYVWVITDSSGVFEWRAHANGGSTDIVLVAYLPYVAPTPPSGPGEGERTWAGLAAGGSGSVLYMLEIPAIGVFSSYSYTPTDDWYVDGGYTLYPWLVYEIDDIVEQIEYLDGKLDVRNITCKIADIGGGMTGLLKGWRGWTHTWLDATLSTTATTATVEDTSALASTGSVYIGQERIEYSTTSTATLQGLTRGTMGTAAAEHYADLTATIPEQPVVSVGPHTLVGRRALLHAAVIDPATGTPGPTTVIYRGRVGSGIRVGSGEWVVPLEPLADVMMGKTAVGLPGTSLERGYWYSGVEYPGDYQDPCGLGQHKLLKFSTDGERTSTISVTVPQGWYTTFSLYVYLHEEFATPQARLHLATVDFDKIRIIRAGSDTHLRQIKIEKYSPLWALGFDEGTLSFPPATSAYSTTAASSPRLFVADFSERVRGDAAARPQIHVTDASKIVEGAHVAIPGHNYCEVHSTTGNVVTLESRRLDRGVSSVHDKGWAVEDEEDDLVLNHVFALGPPATPAGGVAPPEQSMLQDAIKRCLGIHPYQIEPERWCAGGLRYADIDWDELDDAVGSVPETLGRCRTALTEPIETWKAIGHQFALLGICPRITTDGKIGFVRLSTPTATDAVAVEVDDDVWDLTESAMIEARLDDTPLVTEVRVEHSHDYGAGDDDREWGEPIRLIWREGRSLLGKTRSITYSCRGLRLHGAGSVALDEAIEAINEQVVNTHFGTFGRESATIAIPCTWLAKQIRCGDTVIITHPLVPDTVNGEIGVSSRLGLVVGRRLKLTENGQDELDVRIGPDIRVGGIAPCALATGWTTSTKTLVCASAAAPLYEVAGGNDLTRFISTSTVPVRLISYDSGTTSTVSTWSATIAANGVTVSAGTVLLTGDPFSTAIPTSFWISPAQWDSAWTSHRRFAFVGDASTVPTLGSTASTCYRWTI